MLVERLTGTLDRFPRAKHFLHKTVDRTIWRAAQFGLDLNRLRVSASQTSSRQGQRLTLVPIRGVETVQVRPPDASFDAAPGLFRDLVGEMTAGYSRPPVGLLQISGGRFELPGGMVSVGGRLPSELIPLAEFPFSFLIMPTLRSLVGRSRPVPDGVLINLPMSNSYYHWNCAILPRALEAAAETPSALPLYVAETLPSFVFESLEVVGLGERCVRLAPGVYRSEHLTVPTFESAEWPSPFDILTTRARLREALGLTERTSEEGPGRRILISRAGAVGRHILNEPELMASLQDLGFELVNLNAVSVEEQVRLFSAADMIVAPHGAGLTNIMFAPAHCRVVELAVETHCTASYLVIASAVGQRYGYVMCEPRGRNLFVRVDAVRSVLDELEDARECATQPTL